MSTYKNPSDLQLILQVLQRYNQRFNPPKIFDVVIIKKEFKPDNNKSQLQTRLAELVKFISTWKNLNVVTTKQEREAVLDEIESINKQLSEM